MIGYKAFEKGWVCRGFQYEIGKTYELPEGEKLEMCQCGFHFCKNPIDVFGYYEYGEDTAMAEVEALGEIQQQGTKYCTNKIRIVREFTREELKALILPGDGHYNTGYSNNGMFNSGICNRGNSNSGDFNNGGRNAGSYNIGKFNTGSRNIGDSNEGYKNNGDWNSGDLNIGHANSGTSNVGRFNLGCFNIGDFNSGYFAIGCFNTAALPETIFMFNKASAWTMMDWNTSIARQIFTTMPEREKQRQKWWDRLCSKEKEFILGLPNFDAAIFKECTGIDVKEGKDEQSNNL